MKAEMFQLILKEQFLIKKNGFALLEVMLSAALFLIITLFAVQAYLYGEEALSLSGERQRAALYAEEGIEALRNIRDASFATLANGTYGLATSSGSWALSGTSNTDGEFTRQIQVNNLSTDRVIATSTVTWNQNAQRAGIYSIVSYLHNWAKTVVSNITVVGSASNPADNGTLAGPTNTIAPPAGLAAGDLVVIVAAYRGSATLSISATGGQTWTPLTQVANGTNNVSRIFYAVYNGTWSASPSVTVTSGTLALTVVMHAFRNVDPTSVVDVAQVTGTFTAPATPFNVTVPGVTTINDGSLVFVVTATPDDNTWALQTAGWVNTGLAQYRNLSGNDMSISTAYRIISPAGASGNIINRQLTLGGDTGTRHIIAFKRKP